MVKRKKHSTQFDPIPYAFVRQLSLALIVLAISVLAVAFHSQQRTAVALSAKQAKTPAGAGKQNDGDGISAMSLFDGKALGPWKKTDFYQAGNVFVRDSCLILEKSTWMTGVTWTGPLIRMNYELSFEAMRVEGSDFFCGLTFPVGQSSCSLILGGWNNEVCGLSSIDYKDASLNETTVRMSLENSRWYKVDLRVTPNRIQVSLDGEWIVDVDTTGKTIDIRAECLPSLPLGFATYKTTGAIRNIRLAKYPVHDK
jgi:hypothetical protein